MDSKQDDKSNHEQNAPFCLVWDSEADSMSPAECHETNLCPLEEYLLVKRHLNDPA